MTRHRCRQRETGQELAVKIFNYQDEQLTNLKANFGIMKRLDHKNIVKYRDFYTDLKRKLCYLVIELITAPPLEYVELNSEE